jgi:DNA ligase D-like protein (predicted 3'-phosphoesterase)
MSLKEYKAKRYFEKTPEPKGTVKFVKSSPKKRIFVIHEHHASHLHWDLRLEMNGALKSWAVPKEPPLKKGERRLAINVEDHPLSYATFHGTIPEGNYGAGKVDIWDKGKYEIKFQDDKKMEIIFYGKKLKGPYMLVRTHYGNKPDKSWLFFKI